MARAGARAEAKARGEKHYFTGKPCPQGHVAKRLVSSKCCTVCAAEYRAANTDKRRVYWQSYYDARNPVRKTEFPSKAPSYHSEYSRLHYAANKQAYRARDRARRAAVRGLPGRHTALEIKVLAEKQMYRCVYCEACLKSGFEADHIMPISLGGDNSIQNIQLLCRPCNRRKSNRHPVEFAKSIAKIV